MDPVLLFSFVHFSRSSFANCSIVYFYLDQAGGWYEGKSKSTPVATPPMHPSCCGPRTRPTPARIAAAAPPRTYRGERRRGDACRIMVRSLSFLFLFLFLFFSFLRTIPFFFSFSFTSECYLRL